MFIIIIHLNTESWCRFLILILQMRLWEFDTLSHRSQWRIPKLLLQLHVTKQTTKLSSTSKSLSIFLIGYYWRLRFGENAVVGHRKSKSCKRRHFLFEHYWFRVDNAFYGLNYCYGRCGLGVIIIIIVLHFQEKDEFL